MKAPLIDANVVCIITEKGVEERGAVRLPVLVLHPVRLSMYSPLERIVSGVDAKWELCIAGQQIWSSCNLDSKDALSHTEIVDAWSFVPTVSASLLLWQKVAWYSAR